MRNHYTQQFKEYAIYEFAYRNGFKNHAECVLHFGLNEYKRQRDVFFDEYWKEVGKDFTKKILPAKPPKKRSTTSQFIETLSIKIPLILDKIKKDPYCNINFIETEFGINKRYIQGLYMIGVIKNIGSKTRPHRIILRDENTMDLVHELRSFVNQYQKVRHHKRRAHAVNK